MSSNNDPNPPQSPPPQLHPTHTTTTQIFTHTTKTTIAILPTLLSLTLLLFSFRTFLETGTILISTYIDHDPSIKSLLSRLSQNPSHFSHPHFSSSSSSPPKLHSLSSSRRIRRRPSSFLHLSRLSTLTDDLFSDLDYLPPSPYPPNSSLPLSFHTLSFTLHDPSESENTPVHDPRFITIAGLDLPLNEAAALFFLVTLLAAAYGWAIILYVITYSWCHATVFLAVGASYLTKPVTPLLHTLWGGANLGTKRLTGFTLMRWALRDAITQVLGLYYFGEVDDQYSFFKIFVRLKLLPFSVSASAPTVAGYDREIASFLLSWFVVDTVVAFVFTVDSWVTIVNTRRGGAGGGVGGREIVKEGCYVITSMMHQSIQIKCLELILCGAFTRWALARVVGRSVAVLLQSMVEVYFMVVWLVFYFAAKSKDAGLSGRRFGRRELEGILEGLR